ncbi:RIP metalloprotease RseP [Comamonas flocculans]|uniref:Zinc metalloprotease n=1 Tax=Comamonas flocculans TaxID=2597701 RepID=A0A5B8RS47_9BURK|nr:RIP metalloprotease RseP [Comamonas flocculans]QEA11903.1 RIP metalloprotease RseP [Comamonas flocculans]
MLLTVLAFLFALALLIAVHEYGHYRVAVACGVKVLRFSIGFGKPLLRWQRKGSPTEFVLAAFPLGGYVRMLDEREAPVAPEERHLAFNNRPLAARAAIVAAGPLANLVLAVLLYALVNWMGVMEPAPYLARPEPQTVASLAGVQGGEQVLAAALGDESLEPVRSFEDLRWLLVRGALDGQDVLLQLRREAGAAPELLRLPLARLETHEPDTALLRHIGITGPLTPAVLGELVPGGAAERLGLRSGDVVQRIGAARVHDGQQLRALIRASVQDGQPLAQTWQIERGGRVLDILVTPELRVQDGKPTGRIGAWVGGAPEMLMVRYGPWEGLARGVQRTWEVSALTLRMMGRMVIGQASVKNLSGPLTIADYAGKSAHMGLSAYLVFLALISVSLGVLNLLPLPVLDGGHLMYYLWEGVTGRGVSDAWMERLQRGGVALLLVMMTIAVFNDFTRLFG